MVLSLVVFVAISFAAFLVAFVIVEGVLWPVVIGVFCGFTAATVLNTTDVVARRSTRNRSGGETGASGRYNRWEDGSEP